MALGSGVVVSPPVPDYATWSSGGPISHGSSGKVRVDVEHHYVMPGGGQANDLEGDPNPYWDGRPYGFNVNGEFPLAGFGDASVSSGTVMPPLRMTANVVSSIGPTITMAIGAGFGAVLAPQHRATGTFVGALVGGILGLIFSPG